MQDKEFYSTLMALDGQLPAMTAEIGLSNIADLLCDDYRATTMQVRFSFNLLSSCFAAFCSDNLANYIKRPLRFLLGYIATSFCS